MGGSGGGCRSKCLAELQRQMLCSAICQGRRDSMEASRACHISALRLPQSPRPPFPPHQEQTVVPSLLLSKLTSSSWCRLDPSTELTSACAGLSLGRLSPAQELGSSCPCFSFPGRRHILGVSRAPFWRPSQFRFLFTVSTVLLGTI